MSAVSVQNWLFAVIIPGVILGAPQAAATLVYQRSMTVRSPTPLARLLLGFLSESDDDYEWRTRLVAEWGAFTATTAAGFSLILLTGLSLFDGAIPLALGLGQAGSALLLSLSTTAVDRRSVCRKMFAQTVVLYLVWQVLWVGLWVTVVPIHGSGLVSALSIPGRLYYLLIVPSTGLALVTVSLGLGPVVKRHVEIPAIPDGLVAVAASVVAIVCFVSLEQRLLPYTVVGVAKNGFAVALVLALVASVRSLQRNENLQSGTQ